tara:strand:- start:3046 stop:4749 length:1704 start_codon:yes stop_codon:yes gene_type:complete
MNDLDQLKQLLFGAETEALNSIAERVERRDVRTADIADVLPEAIHQSHKKNGELVESLLAPVGECLQQEFRNDPQTYGDALYPVIGPAIRKAIMHALRNFSQQINEAVEHSISPKGLKWRWQASRAGVPYGEYVLQKTMLYRVEQAYLISRENGLLIGHVHHEASRIKDSDAVSAMFTAIQDFVKESFSPDRTGRLESADMGEFTLWAVHGPHALLVCVIRGVPPKSLRAELTAILERIHFRYGEAIREYKGDTASIPDVELELQRCLKFEARAEASVKRKGPSIGALVLGLVLLLAVAYFAARSWTASKELEQFSSALSASPGIHLAEARRSGNQFMIRGLRDPLADEVYSIAEALDIPSERISSDMQPFYSLQPEIIERRAAALFGRTDSVSYMVSGTTLKVTGDAPWSWRKQIVNGWGSLAGIEALDISGLTSNDRTRFAQRVTELDGATFYFDAGVSLREGGAVELREFVARVRQLQDDAPKMGYALQASVIGSTDSRGDALTNERLSSQRADIAINALQEAGIAAEHVMQEAPDSVNDVPIQDTELRFARINLQLLSTASPE